MDSVVHFRFSTDVLRRLGEELNPHPDQGILELVKNSYDADAHQCTVELKDVTSEGGTLRVVDDGDGMDATTIENGWLLLGSSSKLRGERTCLGRRPVGSKGLGRLAALRLGHIVQLETRPRHEANVRYSMRIDWAMFDHAPHVGAIDLTVQQSARREEVQQGTTIVVEGLRVDLKPVDVRRLARALVLLADPFDAQLGFKPRLIAPEFKHLESLVARKYFDFAEYHLVAKLNADGHSSVRILDPAGRELASLDSLDSAGSVRKYTCPPAHFDLWAFRMEGRSDLVPGGPTLSELRMWMEAVGGVHVYQDGIRVGPYGDPDDDWLGMNLSRARSPELRPSTNNSVGRLKLDSNLGALQQKTDRSGFIENEAFRNLRQFAVDALDWMARWRLQQREKRRASTKIERPKEIKAAAQGVLEAIKGLPVPSPRKEEVETAFKAYVKQRERRDRDLERELLLYRALGTVGTTSATFAHESRKPLTNIVRAANLIDAVAKKRLQLLYQGELRDHIDLISRSAKGLQGFTRLTTRLLDHEKRLKQKVFVHESITEVVALLKPHLERMGIETRTQMSSGSPAVHGTPAAIEAIIMNLLTNAMNAIRKQRTAGAGRQILIRTSTSDAQLTLEVLDSGPGIRELSLDEIWLPGQTTTPHGTGLGLTIVRDCALDLGGDVSAQANGDLGGAHFTIRLPIL